MSLSVVIPAFNEEQSIKSVVDTVLELPEVTELVVVDDFSTDNTSAVLNPVDDSRLLLIRHTSNQGKSGALKTGIDNSSGENIMFLDADLVNFKKEHVEELYFPVKSGLATAVIGILSGGRIATDFAQVFAPMLSGMRCIKREVLSNFTMWDTRFGIEVALNDYLKANGVTQTRVNLIGLSHRMKEEKRGFVKGFIDRLAMYWDIIKTKSHLYDKDTNKK